MEWTFADPILGQHISLCRKFSVLNHSTTSSPPKKRYQSPKAFICFNPRSFHRIIIGWFGMLRVVQGVQDFFFHHSHQPLPRIHRCQRPLKLSTQCECTVTTIGWLCFVLAREWWQTLKNSWKKHNVIWWEWYTLSMTNNGPWTI